MPLHKTSLACCAFIGLNALVAIWRIALTTNAWNKQQEPVHDIDWFNPSYTGSNYPMHLPVPPLDAVAMGLHETMRYGLNASEDIGDHEWDTVLHLADGFGRARIGPERRVYVVSYFHQLHCLRGLQRGIVSPGRMDGVSPAPGHIHHCINYLRQTLLCGAMDMLEKGDFMTNDHSAGTVGTDLVCTDWKAVVGDAMQNNYDGFTEWTSQWN